VRLRQWQNGTGKMGYFAVSRIAILVQIVTFLPNFPIFPVVPVDILPILPKIPKQSVQPIQLELQPRKGNSHDNLVQHKHPGNAGNFDL